MEVCHRNFDGIYASAFFEYGNLDLDVLKEIEEDLREHEVISLIFLLFDCCEVSLELATTVLKTANHTFLRKWAENYGPFWKGTLVEALLIIENHRVFEQVNINLEQAKCNFLPYVKEYSLFIHPMKKILYAYCKTFNDTRKAKIYINDLMDTCKVSQDFRSEVLKLFKKFECRSLELFFLKLNLSGKIQFGSWTPFKSMIQDYVKCCITPINATDTNWGPTFNDVELHINHQNALQKQNFIIKLKCQPKIEKYRNYRAFSKTMYKKRFNNKTYSIAIATTELDNFKESDELCLSKCTALLGKNEKISLKLLLSDPCDITTVILESTNKKEFIKFLCNWARAFGKHWLGALVEALAIINNENAIKMLNVKYKDAKSYFLPNCKEYSYFIHPMKKILYLVFKTFNEKLIKKFKKYVDLDNYEFDCNEMILIQFLLSGNINIGSWILFSDESKNYNECDISLIADFLQACDYPDFQFAIQNVQQRINHRIKLQNTLLRNAKIPIKTSTLTFCQFSYDPETDLQFHDSYDNIVSDLPPQPELLCIHGKKLEMMEFIESDLNIDNKISLLFLLCDSRETALSLISCVTTSDFRIFLYYWSESYGSYWLHALMKALHLIQYKRPIIELYNAVEVVNQHTLLPQSESALHPIKKSLFLMDKQILQEIIKEFKDKPDKEKNVEHIFYEFLEIMLKLNIQIGSWRPSNNMPQDDALLDLKKIKEFLSNARSSDWTKSLQLLPTSDTVATLYSGKSSMATIQNLKHNLEKLVKTLDQVIVSSQDRQIALDQINNAEIDIKERYLKMKSIFTGDIKKLPYPIKNPINVGYFLIINNIEFEGITVLNKREGSQRDIENISNCWASFGFTIVSFINKKHNEILDTIRDYLEKVEEEHGAFGVCISSHGDVGVIYGSDSIPVEVLDLKEILSNNLVGKPKILIVQSCRGSNIAKEQKLMPDIKTMTDARPILSNTSNIIKKRDFGTADFLVFWATVESYVAYRHTINGSMFIQILCECMLKFGEKMHIVDVFTRVTDKLSAKVAQVSQFDSTLRNELWLQKVQIIEQNLDCLNPLTTSDKIYKKIDSDSDSDDKSIQEYDSESD